MKLLFVVYGSLEQISGGYLYDRMVIDYLEDHGVRVELLRLPPCPYPLCPLQNFRAVLRRAFMTAGTYDCILIDELTHPSVFLAVSRRAAAVPVVVLLHHLKARERIGTLQRVFVRAMEARLLGGVDAVIVNSRTTKDTIRHLVRADTAVYVCPPGSDTFAGMPAPLARDPQIAPESSDPDPVRLLVTGNLIPRKGHDLLMRMLGSLTDLHWELRVVGGIVDRRFKRRVDRLARRAGVRERVRYTGVLAGKALYREYLEADVFVFPSRYEGFGIALAEAVRAGLPFVAFASGAVPEVTGGRGLFAEPGDLRFFQDKLRRLIEDAEYRDHYARLSARLSEILPTWRQTGEAFLKALREIV